MARWTPALDDLLCSYVETDRYSFGQIAEHMGMSRDQVTSRWRKIVTRMGCQTDTPFSPMGRV